MTGNVGRWMLFDLGCADPGYWWDGGDGAEPEWEWFEDSTEPIEVLAERFIAEDSYLIEIRDGGVLYRREERRRWFGLTEHEWDEGPDMTDWLCANCGLTSNEVQGGAPWDEHCRPPEEEE